MDETILFPSPNWFQPSGLAVSNDEWVFYGGPSKSLCVLEPLPADYDTVVKGHQGYTAHVVNRAHPEKIVCVDINPEWPEKRSILTGSSDGTVKQWNLENTQNNLKIKSSHSHEIHSHEKEEVVGVGYCKDGYAVTIGSYGIIVKWDLNSNVAKSFNHVLKSFKPVCMACSPHIHMHVAIGTKQGVLFVFDLSGSPRIVYKVRGQDDEILKVSWCPQYEVAVRKCLKESDKRSAASERMEKIRQEPEPPEVMKILDEKVKNSHTTEQPIKINEKSEAVPEPTKQEVFDESGVKKTLPDDSFDESIVVQEDDMFDIYKDHEADEFGHKKFQPVDVMVKVATETVKEEYLSECQKLKEEILKRKAQAESNIGDLVDAMEKTGIEAKPQETPSTSKPDPPVEGKITKGEVESSVHIHKHLLATIGKHGSIRVWSKSGKLVGSCMVFSGQGGNKNQRGQQRASNAGCTTLLWCQPDSLLIADGKSQVLDCNPLKIDCKNKLEWRVLHSLHSRGLFALATTAPRVQTPDMSARATHALWSAAQDRSLARYCVKTGQSVVHHTCGGFLYTVKPCPYDACRLAVSVGDGAVRVWEATTTMDDESKLTTTRVLKYWQNVLGKVLVTAWHPVREHVLAFATAESRVGVIDARASEKPARVLQPAAAGGVYSLCWGQGTDLYATAAGALLRYNADHTDQAPTPISVELEGGKWEISAVHWSEGRGGLVVGSHAGAVAVLTEEYKVEAAAFVYSKMIHSIEWHPAGTMGEASPWRDLLAVCSLDKANSVVILRLGEKEDGGKQLSVWKTLVGHSATVLQLAWSPHEDTLLLSTSHSGTVRVWDISTGETISIFGGHSGGALGAAWSLRPSLANIVVSGGADCCLRLWNTLDHPADKYQETKHETAVEKKQKNKNKREKKSAEKAAEAEKKASDDSSVDALECSEAVSPADLRRRHNKKFLLPLIHKQTSPCHVRGPRKMLQRYLEKSRGVVSTSGAEHGIDYIKIFGNINEVNEVLDTELERHQDTGNTEGWAVLMAVRGYIDPLIQLAAQQHALDPFLLSIAPAVSFKFWKDATLLYLQQIDRLYARGEDHKLNESKAYGGAIYRKMVTQLSLHDVKGAVLTLLDARLFKEAYVLSRARYVDSLAEQTLRVWAHENVISCQYNLAAVCYIALGDLSQAAAALGKSSDEDSLSLAADIAKTLGQNTFAGHVEEKRDQIKNKRDQEEKLNSLPTRAELTINLAERDEPASDVIDKDSVEDNDNSARGDKDTATNGDASDETTLVDIPVNGDEPIKEIPSAKLENVLEVKSLTVDNNEDKTVKEISLTNKDCTEKTLLKEDIATEGQTQVKGQESVKDSQVTETLEIGDQKSSDFKHMIEDLLEQLPKEMESLMKDPIHTDVPLNGTHKGDGDTIQTSGATKKVDTKILGIGNGDGMPQANASIE